MDGEDSRTPTVLKVGGSLIDVATDLIIYLIAAQVDALVVPGGGPFAETVRHYSGRLDETTAHWMAILATNQYGFYLASSGAELVEDLRTVECGIRILLPFRVLYERDPLPHSWNATADSVAGWVAHQLNADLVIATDVDGIFSANEVISTILASDLTSETCVDALLPELLEKFELNCTIVNGRDFQRVVDAIGGRNTIGTTIIGRK
ncbi:MAG TPA: amino acid kinase [Candidatus Bathyarchaeia archaeon]|nr:amino acid kinase [Candidatus Bathyarchaeia archaeon]